MLVRHAFYTRESDRCGKHVARASDAVAFIVHCAALRDADIQQSTAFEFSAKLIWVLLEVLAMTDIAFIRH